MRLTALFIAVVLAFLAVVPGDFFVLSFAADETPAIDALDVCHARGGSMSFDLPYLLSCPCMPLPLRFAGTVQVFSLSMKLSILSFLDERPPEFPA